MLRPSPTLKACLLANGAAEDDVEALARMLESETRDPGARVVIGWMAIESARRRKQTVHRRLTGTSGKYGPQKLDGQVRYASTAQEAKPPARKLAQELLSGRVRPSQAIRSRGHSAWVEQGVGGYTPKRMLDKQYGENGYGGIWARIEGTRWYLYNAKEPVLTYDATDPASAEAVFAQVPEIRATDEGPALARDEFFVPILIV